MEQAGKAGDDPKGREAHPIRYSVDVTDLVDRLRASEPEGAAAGTTRPVRVGTVSLSR